MESATEEGPSSSRRAKAFRWIRGCLHYRFPASIDPFTSESPARYSSTERYCPPSHPSYLFSSTRPDVRAVDDAGVPGVELERVAHPSPLGLSLPDPRQHLLLAADRLPVRLHLHHGHHRLPASAAVCPRRGHRGESRDSRSHQIQ